MPITRWHGWGAKCGACGRFVEIGDGFLAFAERAHVRDAVRPEDMKCLYPTIEDAIRALCGCKGKKR